MRASMVVLVAAMVAKAWLGAMAGRGASFGIPPIGVQPPRVTLNIV